MIDEKFCKSQLDRLAHLQGFPKAPAGVRDLICGLQVADTEAIARQLIDEVVSNAPADHPLCPLVPDLRRLAYEANEREAIKRTEAEPPKPRAWHCARCQDFGIAESIQAVSGASGLESIASWCDCDAGRIISRRERVFTPESINAARAKLRARFPKWRERDPLWELARG